MAWANSFPSQLVSYSNMLAISSRHAGGSCRASGHLRRWCFYVVVLYSAQSPEKSQAFYHVLRVAPPGKIRWWCATAVERCIRLRDQGQICLRSLGVREQPQLRGKGGSCMAHCLQTTLRTAGMTGGTERRPEIHHGLIDHPGLSALR